MVIDFEINKYRQWLQENITLSDPFSPDSLRTIILYLILGKNYRLLTERNTKEKLFATYVWLSEIYDRAKKEYGENWKEKMLKELMIVEGSSKEEKDLMFWLLGLTKKTADNLDISREDFPDFLNQTIIYCKELFSSLDYQEKEDYVWLLMMAGSATLNIRGSQKAKIGKGLERTFLRVALTLLGLELGENFWVNIGRDLEVEREADAEVQTKRGRIRIDIGLIARGNQEVIEDKINRVGRHGVVIFDRLGARSTVYETARRNMVKLIQIRHNQPLLELKRHLTPLVNVELKQIPQEENKLKNLLKKLPDKFFTIEKKLGESEEDE